MGSQRTDVNPVAATEEEEEEEAVAVVVTTRDAKSLAICSEFPVADPYKMYKIGP
jgi:hypothetical protein